MPRWFGSRRADTPDGPTQGLEPTSPADSSSELPAEEGRRVEARLRQDLAELLKSHRQQSRVLERNQKQLEQAELDAEQLRAQATAQHRELAELRRALSERSGRIVELEAAAKERARVQAEHEDRLTSELTAAHATIAARDAEIASRKNAEEAAERELIKARQSLEEAIAEKEGLKAEIARAAELEAANHRLELENETLVARWDVARTQLAEAEQALSTSQATIKAAQRLSSSMEWRGALDGVLDAASELVRFERGTLALVDELQEELKVEAARNSPIAVSEMSRFKVGEGIAGWALSHREPVLVRDSRSDARFKASDPKHQPRSFIAVPLLANDEGLGVLTLARAATDPFSESDLRNLARVASDASNALTNARLVDLLKQREDRLTTLVRKARELTAAEDLKAVVDFALSSARELGAGKAALLAIRNPKTLDLEILGTSGLDASITEQRIAWGAPAAADVMKSGRPWVSPLREMLPSSLADTVEKAGLKTLISVACGRQQQAAGDTDLALLNRSAVAVVEETSGVLNVYRDTLDPIGAADLDQLKAFAEQVAVAIQNVRRAERVREQLQASASQNARLMGRERYIGQLLSRIQQLEKELGRYKAA